MTRFAHSVHTINDLQRAWLAVRRQERFWQRQLYVMFIDSNGQPCPRLLRVGRLPKHVSPEFVDHLLRELSDLAQEQLVGGTVAILTCMTKRGLADELELQWCRALRDGLLEAPFRSWPLFHGSSSHLGLVPLDALVTRNGHV